MSDELAILNQTQIVASTLVAMGKLGLDHGSYYTMGQLKEFAGPVWSSADKFRYFIMGLQEALRHRGFCFSRRGLKNEGYRITQAVENSHYMEQQGHQALSALERAIVLGVNTDKSVLTDAERKRHDNVLRETQHQRMMLLRSDEVVDVLTKHKKGLLKPTIDLETQVEQD
jgi:hypothetical protein